MKKSCARVFLALFFLNPFFSSCESDEAKLEHLFRDFSKAFYQRFPDSAAVVGLRLEPEKCLQPPSRAVFEANFLWLQNLESELKTLESATFSTENERKRQLLIQKAAALKNRIEPKKVDAALFDVQIIWLAALENPKISEVDRRAFFEKMLERTPAFLTGARSLGADFFAKNSFEKAETETRAAFFFLQKRAHDFSKNPAFQNALLALKDWLAFCESARKMNVTR